MKLNKFFNTFLIFSVSNYSFGQTDNFELQKMYEEDQNSRTQKNINWEKLNFEDKERERRVFEMINEGKIITAKDYYNSAMIFQHGTDTIASSMAVKHMKKAVELDPNTDKWLLAAAIDRDLMRRNKPQIYGTQFIKNEFTNGKIILYQIDTTKVTDDERREYNVETLAELKIKEQNYNVNSFNELIQNKDFEESLIIIRNEYNNKNSLYKIDFNDLLEYTNVFLKQKKYEQACELAKLCTELYPDRSFAFYIYGVALLGQKNKDEAIKSLTYSLKLDPSNKAIEGLLENLKK
jgi:tetratricopeptide (TPR) repeat protein